GLRPRPGARGRLAVRRLPACPERRGRCGRALRRELLHVQRGDGLVLPLPRRRLEGVVLPRRGGRPRRRRVARRPPVPREPAQPSALLREALRPAAGRARAPAAALVAPRARARLPGLPRARVSRRRSVADLRTGAGPAGAARVILD